MSFLGGLLGGRRAADDGTPRPPSALAVFLDQIHFPAPTHENGRTGFHLFGQAYLDLNQFKYELIFTAISVLYVAWYLVARTANHRRANAWINVVLPELQKEFANIATDTPYGSGALVWNGAAEAVLFATGRRAVDSFHAFMQFAPWHDPLYLIVNGLLENFTGGSSASYERPFITLSFNLAQTADNISGVFALIDKSALRDTKTSSRFDLSFGKLLEASNASTQRKLDNKWAILTESNDLTDLYLGEINDKGDAQREKVGIQQLLDPANPASKWLESLVITDQPFLRPTTGPIPTKDRPRRIVLTLRIPSSAAQAKETLPLLGLALDLADALNYGTSSESPSIAANSPLKLRADTVTKLRKTRQEVEKQLEEEATREEREKEAEKRAEAKAKADKEKWEKMSPAEQERRREVERKRAMKKGSAIKKRA